MPLRRAEVHTRYQLPSTRQMRPCSTIRSHGPESKRPTTEPTCAASAAGEKTVGTKGLRHFGQLPQAPPVARKSTAWNKIQKRAEGDLVHARTYAGPSRVVGSRARARYLASASHRGLLCRSPTPSGERSRSPLAVNRRLKRRQTVDQPQTRPEVVRVSSSRPRPPPPTEPTRTARSYGASFGSTAACRTGGQDLCRPKRCPSTCGIPTKRSGSYVRIRYRHRTCLLLALSFQAGHAFHAGHETRGADAINCHAFAQDQTRYVTTAATSQRCSHESRDPGRGCTSAIAGVDHSESRGSPGSVVVPPLRDPLTMDTATSSTPRTVPP